MTKRQIAGAFIFAGCIGAFFAYALLLILSDWSQHVLYISILMIVGGILGAISWVGYSKDDYCKTKTSSITALNKYRILFGDFNSATA